VIAAEHRKAFAVDGYAVMPQVIPRYLIVGARAEMKRIVALNPPAPDYRGFHFCFLNEIPQPLLALVIESPAMAVAQGLNRAAPSGNAGASPDLAHCSSLASQAGSTASRWADSA
jgi:hypothetical protein